MFEKVNMEERMRKTMASLLALVMMMALFAAPVALGEEPFVITVVCPQYEETPPENSTGEEGNPLLELMEENQNIDLQITWSPQGDYETKFNTVMASKDQPMVMVVNSGITTNANYLTM